MAKFQQGGCLKSLFWSGLIVVISTATFTATASSTLARSEPKKVGDSEWRGQMQSMLVDVLDLIPFVYTENEKFSKNDQKKVLKSIQSLEKSSANLKAHTQRFIQEKGGKIDPSYSFIADSFELDLSQALASFEKEKVLNEKTRNHLKSAVAKCMLCHTQSGQGPELKLDQFKSQFAKLEPIDRFYAMAATRQFDGAMDEFKKIIGNQSQQTLRASSLDRTARAAIAILVRVKKDPQQAELLLTQMEKSKSFSSVIASDFADWKKSLQSWKSEKPKEFISDKDLYSEAQRLSQKLTQDGDKPEIDLLRASSLLHDLLIRYPESSLRPQTYLLLADIYDSLPGFSIWDLANEYLGACILEYPHSKIGEKCFQKYEDITVFGYTGSAGTQIPASVTQHLLRMRELAKEKSKEKKQ